MAFDPARGCTKLQQLRFVVQTEDLIRRAELKTGRIVVIDKPAGWTSFDVVNKLRRLSGVKKVGHAGTLDPFATGVLLVCFGSATKQVNALMALDKEYQGILELGTETDSHDVTGRVVAQRPVPELARDQIEQAFRRYLGEITQIPPMFSALKRNGQRLYKLARKGEQVELEPRKVKIHAFDVLAVKLPEIHFQVICSRGTYVRALARDLGRDFGCGAHLKTLRRTRVGSFSVDSALSIEQFAARLTD
ncbi:MAG: tRNA pseudouridine(55) synthase TruB [candidate division KSB1 bacterium]|nr:tRNA pseudouridine(55) synthase TruB [candidate division KSB1 bacterium]MDZ7303491.1 tRNA pseudouridine(55) synthase TruB [candidate division KSB1 bacterium]MDZ7312707.1 tRNA pseudouridine(55) synthase TruB [candidate division KSB1 bacterium]